MKKSLLAIALAVFAFSASAQEAPVSKYSVATNSFWANWFVQAGFSAHMTFSSQEASDMDFFKIKERGQIGASLAVGKWFTPGIGLRTKARVYRDKAVFTEDIHPSFSYWQVTEDVMFNLSNLLCGYNETRVWNFIPYVGIGVNKMMTFGGKDYDLVYNGGLLNTFRLSKRFSVFLDIYAQATEGSFDRENVFAARSFNPRGVAGDPGDVMAELADVHYWGQYAKYESRHWDKQLGVDLGVQVNISKTTGWSKVPDVAALTAMYNEQLDAMRLALKNCEDENQRLLDLIAAQPTDNGQARVQTQTQTQIQYVDREKPVLVGSPASVFFNIGKSTIASRRDLVNVQDLATIAKEKGYTLLVTGYADSATGTEEINNRLAQERAEAVAAELQNMGVPASQIETVAKGGVDTLTPFEYNRRATVTIK
ncbi:MAG: OmpA family protein [Bacteroidaceae bacterium]|nr:OmpA family protein [Bacteroidaceae bacterium]